MRLTEKFTSACGGCYEPITNDREVCDKLGQLEDIEEELGIDLIILAKVIINQKIFIIGWNDQIQEVKITNFGDKKKLKALEIIKEKEVAVFVLNSTTTVDEYNTRLFTYGTNQELTQEEYDLLKEVLL